MRRYFICHIQPFYRSEHQAKMVRRGGGVQLAYHRVLLLPSGDIATRSMAIRYRSDSLYGPGLAGVGYLHQGAFFRWLIWYTGRF